MLQNVYFVAGSRGSGVQVGEAAGVLLVRSLQVQVSSRIIKYSGCRRLRRNATDLSARHLPCPRARTFNVLPTQSPQVSSESCERVSLTLVSSGVLARSELPCREQPRWEQPLVAALPGRRCRPAAREPCPAGGCVRGRSWSHLSPRRFRTAVWRPRPSSLSPPGRRAAPGSPGRDGRPPSSTAFVGPTVGGGEGDPSQLTCVQVCGPVCTSLFWVVWSLSAPLTQAGTVPRQDPGEAGQRSASLSPHRVTVARPLDRSAVLQATCPSSPPRASPARGPLSPTGGQAW